MYDEGEEHLAAAVEGLRRFEAEFLRLLGILNAPKPITESQREQLVSGFGALKAALQSEAKRGLVPGPKHPQTTTDLWYSRALNRAFTELQPIIARPPITSRWYGALREGLAETRGCLKKLGQPPTPD